MGEGTRDDEEQRETAISGDEDTHLAYRPTATSDQAPVSVRADGLAAGVRVSDNLTLECMLGQGGMGSVWIAHHAALDTQVAVKFIASERHRKSKAAQKRFEREARIAAKLKNPHTVQIFDHGMMEDGTPYIVMELLEGESVGEHLDRVGTMTMREAEILLTQTAEVLSEAHEMGVVHRDIKPDNLFLVATRTHELFVKVLDFGVAKHTAGALKATAVTATGTIVGTPMYMSPEQLLGSSDATASSDLWALGVVIYEALVGEPPFEGATVAALGVSVATGVFKAASGRRAALGARVDEWFTKALAREPSDRFASATDMARAFSAAIRETADDPVEAAVTVRSDDLPAREHAVAATNDAVTSSRASDVELAKARDQRWRGFAVAGVLTALGAAALIYQSNDNEALSDDPADAALSVPEPEAASAEPSISPEPSAIETSSAETSASASATAKATSAPAAAHPKPPPVGAHPKPPPVYKPPPVPGPPATVKLPPVPGPPAEPKRPAWCDDASRAFIVDDQGHLTLKPQCR